MFLIACADGGLICIPVAMVVTPLLAGFLVFKREQPAEKEESK